MRRLSTLVCLIQFLALATFAEDARSIREVKVSLNLSDVRLEEALERIEAQTEFRFVYSSENVNKDQVINLKVYDVSVAHVLEELFRGKNLIVRQHDYQVMIKGYHRAPRPKIVVEQEYGGVIGTVTDAANGEGLPGATVSLSGTSIGAVTNLNGAYTLARVPAGEQQLTISFLGYEPQTQTVEVPADGRVTLDVELQSITSTMEEIVITSQALGQQAAINQQINSNTIVSIVSEDKIRELPDQNAAESVGRLPGIAIQRNAGEGQKVVVRGLSPRFNAITINGERIPSTDPRDRSVDLSMISPEQLAGIEVFKALTPDKDGDAIGGTVNFVVKRAPQELQTTVRAQTGYNSIADEFGQYKVNASVSNRFVNNKLGVLVTGNYQRANRSSDVLSTDWGTPQAPDRVEVLTATLSDIIEVRNRYGGSVALDYDLAPGHALLLNTLWGETDRDELRRRRTYNLEENVQDYDLRDRELRTRLISNALSGEHALLNQSLELTWRGSYSLSRQTTPYSHQMRFREINAFAIPQGGFPAGATPAFLADSARNNFSSAFLRRGELNDDVTAEDIYTLQVDLKKVLNFGSGNRATLKAGLKHRIFDRRQDAVQFRDRGNGNREGFLDFLEAFPDEYATLSDNPQLVGMTDFLGDYRADDFLNNSLDFGPGLDQAAVNRFAVLFGDDFYYRNDLIDDQDYEALEQISAGYAMAQVDWGKVMLLGGARVEYTNARYVGFRTAEIEDDNLGEDEVGRTFREQRSSAIDYTEVLPMLHARYKPTEWFDVRAAVTKSLARPDFQNLVPWASINAFESQAELGNPALQHMIAWNYDLFFSFYRNFGLFTVGVFQKELTNVDVEYDFVESDRNDQLFGFDVVQPINITEPTTVRGVEVDFQANLSQLPAPLDGLVLSANATFIESSTQYPFFERQGTTGAPLFTPRFGDSRRGGSMPGQPDFTANLSVGYEKGGFSGRLSMLVQDNSFTRLGSRPEFDSYSRLLVRWDAVLSQNITRRWQVFANWNNITNAPQEAFQFREAFITEQEYFGFTADLGLRYRFINE